MIDIVLTAPFIVPTANTIIARGTCGTTGTAAITPGQSVYADSTNNLIKPAQAVGGSQAQAAAIGLALNQAYAGGPIEYATGGDVTVTVTGGLITGKVYVLGAGAGGLSLSADLDSAAANTRYGTIMAVAVSATLLRLGITVSGVLRA